MDDDTPPELEGLSLEEQAALYDKLIAQETAQDYHKLYRPDGTPRSRKERRALGFRGPVPTNGHVHMGDMVDMGEASLFPIQTDEEE